MRVEASLVNVSLEAIPPVPNEDFEIYQIFHHRSGLLRLPISFFRFGKPTDCVHRQHRFLLETRSNKCC
jgi:hypothetical protein